MRGALESLADYMYLIIAIIVGGLMFYFIAHYSGLFGESKDVNVHGNGFEVSKRIAEEVKDCWEAHRNGLDPASDVCIELHVNSTEAFSEWSMTKYLDCKAIPDNNCLPANCSACTSASYADPDKVGWDVKSKAATIDISYDGYERKIMVEEVGQSQNIPASSNNSTSSCVGQGQLFMPICDMPNWTAPQCCSGLNAIPAFQMYKNLTDCQPIYPMAGGCTYAVCAKCGDGVCNSSYENKCNCPNDCGLLVSITSPNIGDKFNVSDQINFTCAISRGTSPYQISWVIKKYPDGVPQVIGSSQSFETNISSEAVYNVSVYVNDSWNNDTSSGSSICVQSPSALCI